MHCFARTATGNSHGTGRSLLDEDAIIQAEEYQCCMRGMRLER